MLTCATHLVVASTEYYSTRRRDLDLEIIKNRPLINQPAQLRDSGNGRTILPANFPRRRPTKSLIRLASSLLVI